MFELPDATPGPDCFGWLRAESDGRRTPPWVLVNGNAERILALSIRSTRFLAPAFCTLAALGALATGSPAHDAMIFTAGGAGLPGSTMITVNLANSAFDAASGQTMFAPYHLSFHTGAGAAEIPGN